MWILVTLGVLEQIPYGYQETTVYVLDKEGLGKSRVWG